MGKGESSKSEAWAWWESMGSPSRVLAPMVGQSELAFRELVRGYGADLCVTPMVHSRMFNTCPRYRKEVLRDLGDSEDRPLLIQFCGDDKDARVAVVGLAVDAGLRGLEGGPLDNAVAAEALTSILIWMNRRYGSPGAGIHITGLPPEAAED